MAYPDDKETWERVDTNEIIVKGATNNWQIFLEALQDTLGLSIKLGYGTVKLLLDYLKSKADIVDDKLNKIDGVAGNSLAITGTSPILEMRDDLANKRIFLEASTFPKLRTQWEWFEFFVDNGAGEETRYMTLRNTDLVVEHEYRSNKNGGGVVLKSPNGTHTKRIYVDNDGNIAVQDA